LNIYSNGNNLYSWNGPFPIHPFPWAHSGSSFGPYGHIIDTQDALGNRVLIQTWYHCINIVGAYSLMTYISKNNGVSFVPGPVIDSVGYNLTHPSMVDLGGGDLLVLACPKAYPYQFQQYVSHDYGLNWIADTNLTQFDFGQPNDIPSPPFLSYINFEGVGIIICYYTHIFQIGSSNPPTVYQAIAPANEIVKLGLNGITSTASSWCTYRKSLQTSPLQINTNSGFESFFHPLNQFKGIGLTFSDTGTNPGNTSVPMIIFTETHHMLSDILNLWP